MVLEANRLENIERQERDANKQAMDLFGDGDTEADEINEIEETKKNINDIVIEKTKILEGAVIYNKRVNNMVSNYMLAPAFFDILYMKRSISFAQ